MSSDNQPVIDRLFSKDANDRVKAAGEIGEIGNRDDAPIVLRVSYEDEASTVRQMAIQSYFEILGDESFDEISKAASSHYDEYVKLYAISILGNFQSNKVESILEKLVEDPNYKVRVAAIKAMIHSGCTSQKDHLLSLFPDDESEHVSQVLIEALALWKVKKSKQIIEEYLQSFPIISIELKTVLLFALASFGSKDALKRIETEEIDTFYSVKINDKRYRGRTGLLSALKAL